MPAALTPYPDVNAVLSQLLSNAKAVLGSQFAGLYLYGSLASGDFDPVRSDIDFVVATVAELPSDMVSALEVMHARLKASELKWAKKLEGTYVPRAALRRYDPNAAPCPCLNEGKFHMAREGSDWIIQLHILREHGVVLAGPDPRTLIDPVSPDDLRQAVQGILDEWWLPTLSDPGWMRGSEYHAFAVLTMCRALHTLHHGTIVSKLVAAGWAKEALGAGWASLIEWAVTWSPDTSTDRLEETLNFIRHTLAISRQFNNPDPVP